MEIVLKELAAKRPIFHSEADFQLELFRALMTRLDKSQGICLEASYKRKNNASSDGMAENKDKQKHKSIDIVINRAKRPIIAIELKYKTAKCEYAHEEEPFTLKNQVAHNYGRYGFWNDVRKLQDFVADRDNEGCTGYAIFLTNDDKYEKPSDKGNSDHDFGLEEGSRSKGMTLKWKDGRMDPITLNQKYNIVWNNWSNEKNIRFRFLLVPILSPFMSSM